MQIKELYIYPIKSLRGISLPTSSLTQQGLQYDRRFMLLKVLPDFKLENMHIVHHPEMSLFQPLINTKTNSTNSEITVTYQMPKEPLVPHHPDQEKPLSIPLDPEFRDLERIEVNMHQSPTSAYKMSDEFNSWFSNCFGYPVVLAYLGDSTRRALGSVAPNAATKKSSSSQSKSSWLNSVSSLLPLPGQYQGVAENEGANDDGISFSDCAPFLVVTLSSLNTIHPRLNEDGDGGARDLGDGKEQMDVRKFRPNVVLDGDEGNPWDEDFWGELVVKSTSLPPGSNGIGNGNRIQDENQPGVRIILTANCGRCKSINIDYETGKPGIGPSGSALKKLMRDRRVDKGVKYSPVFGRYGFLDGATGKTGLGKISVGDEVVVSKRNEERTTFEWPGLTN